MLCPILKRPGLCRRWPLASGEGIAMCATRKDKRHHCWKVHLHSHQPHLLPGEGTRLIPQSSKNPQSCELRGRTGPVSHQQFPFLNSSPIHFIPTWGWLTVTSWRAPAQTSSTLPVTRVLGTKTCRIFNSLWQSHLSFCPGKCHHMGEILPSLCPCSRLGLCFLVYPGQLEHA